MALFSVAADARASAKMVHGIAGAAGKDDAAGAQLRGPVGDERDLAGLTVERDAAERRLVDWLRMTDETGTANEIAFLPTVDIANTGGISTVDF